MKRLSAFVAGVALVALMLSVGAPANAIVTPTPPTPVNFLPSVINGAIKSFPAATKLDYNIAMMYRLLKTPGALAGIQAYQQGKATPTQLQQLKTLAAAPATKLAPLIRSGGGILTAVSGYQIGTMFGGGILDVVGFDRTGAVCKQTAGIGQSIVGLLTGVDCSNFEKFDPNLQINQGIVATPPGWTGTNYGAAPNVRVQITGVATGRTMTYSVTVMFAGSNAYNMSNMSLFCKNSTTNAVSFAASSPALPWGSYTAGASAFPNPNYVFTCPVGSVVHSLVASSVLPGNVNTGTTLPQYVAPGHPQAANYPGTNSNPSRTLRCVIAASNGSTYTDNTAPYTEADGVLPAPKCPILPDGVTPITTTIYEVIGTTQTELWKQDTTTEFQAAQQLAPECSSGTCLLDLKKNNVSCFQTPTDCVEWFKDPNKTTNYSCSYGTHAVDLAECSVYAPTFNPQDQALGQNYADWEGKPIPQPGTGTGAGTNPDNRNCWTSAWGDWNPLTWVLLPVKCAWEWAMIPSPGHIQQFTANIQNKFDQTPPGRITKVLITQTFPVIGSGCEGFTVSLAWMKQGAFSNADFPASFKLLSACPGEPMHPFAVFTHLLLTVGIIVVGIRTWPALIGRMFNYSGVDG